MGGRLFLACLLAGGVGGCLTSGVATCGLTAKPHVVAELIFGRNIGDRLGVGEGEFRRFVDEEVTPRFPDGFTVLDGHGQWREGGRIVREPSKVLVVALVEEERGRAELAAIAEAYKARFRQHSVITILRPGCVSF
jgi:Protein of unknown function (DUF3574)